SRGEAGGTYGAAEARLALHRDVDVARAKPADLERLARIRDRFIVHIFATSKIDLLARALDGAHDRNDPAAPRHLAAHQPDRGEVERLPCARRQEVPGREVACVARAHLERWKLKVFPAGRQLEQLHGEIKVLLVDRELEMSREQAAHLGGLLERVA